MRWAALEMTKSQCCLCSSLIFVCLYPFCRKEAQKLSIVTYEQIHDYNHAYKFVYIMFKMLLTSKFQELVVYTSYWFPALDLDVIYDCQVQGHKQNVQKLRKRHIRKRNCVGLFRSTQMGFVLWFPLFICYTCFVHWARNWKCLKAETVSTFRHLEIETVSSLSRLISGWSIA